MINKKLASLLLAIHTGDVSKFEDVTPNKLSDKPLHGRMYVMPSHAQLIIPLFVSDGIPAGNDTNDGITENKPFATLGRAFSEIKKDGTEGIVIYFVSSTPLDLHASNWLFQLDADNGSN